MNHSLVRYIVCMLFIATLVGLLYLVHRQQNLEQEMQELRTKDSVLQDKIEQVPAAAAPLQPRIVSSTQLWRPVQEKVHNTVVQIFTQIAAIDILQPYKTPAQGAAYGSGFFINDEGYIITNAHVVAQAKAIWIQIPGMGKQIIDVEVVGISPERDLALVRVTPECVELIKEQLGAVPFLPLGNSDTVLRSDEVLALGYPLGQQCLKSTTGVISGRERHLIQMSAPINPGSSGGPLLNSQGEVVGINSSGIVEAQNVGYAIPINDLKLILPELYTTTILRKPYLGVFFNNGSIALTQYLNNPLPGGCFVAGVIKDSTLDKVGVQRGDMIYEINGYPLDLYGEMRVPWSEDKISIIDYVGHLSTGQNVSLVIYRNGARLELNVPFDLGKLPAIRKVYPGYEPIEYEIFGGMVVMELTLNHIHMLIEAAPGLAFYAELKNQNTPVLVITHMFPNSQVFRSRAVMIGMTLNEINGIPVTTLDEFRKAIKKGMGGKYLTIGAVDNVTRASDNTFVVLEYEKIMNDEEKFAADYKYPLSTLVKEFLMASRIQGTILPSYVQ